MKCRLKKTPRVNRNKKKVIYRRWVISYLIIIIIPILCSSFFGYKINEIVLEEVEKSNQLILSQFKKDMDETSLMIRNLTSEIAMNPKLDKILYYSSNISGSERYAIHEFMGDLRNKKISYSELGGFYIYIAGMDSVISENEILSSHKFYKFNESEYFNNYEQWQELLKGKHKNYITFSKNQKNHENAKLTFIRELPLFNKGYVLGNIIIYADISKLMKTITKEADHHLGGLMIIDQDGNTVASTMNTTEIDSIELNTGVTQRLSEKEGTFYSFLEGKQVIVSFLQSDIENWSYVYTVPNDVFRNKANYIRNLIAGVMFIYFILSTVLAYFFININYKPISAIIDALGYKDIEESNIKQNEYAIIQKSIQMMVEEKSKINTFINKQKDIFKIDYIKKLLRGAAISFQQERILSEFNINFEHNAFAVIITDIKNIDNRFYSTGTIDKEENDLITFIISNVLEEIMSEKYMGYVVKMDELLVCLVNLDVESADGAKDNIIEILRNTQQYLESQFKVNCGFVLSDIHIGYEKIVKGYEEALELREYRFVIADNDILELNDVMEMGKNQTENYYYPVEKQQELKVALKKGDADHAKSVINDIFRENFEVQLLMPRLAKLLIFEITETIITIYTDGETISEELLNFSNIQEVKTGLLQMIDTCCNQITLTPEKANSNEQIEFDVDRYIEENYTNPDLNISMIAQDFNLHPFYLSKIYKEKSDESILDVITRIRVDKSKQILKDYTVEEVAIRVGYTNARTFTRGFKKVEGITPGKYKKDIDSVNS